jgi:hypothetical protein
MANTSLPTVKTLETILDALREKKSQGFSLFALCFIADKLVTKGSITVAQRDKFKRYLNKVNKDFKVMYNGQEVVGINERLPDFRYYHWKVKDFTSRETWLKTHIIRLKKREAKIKALEKALFYLRKQEEGYLTMGLCSIIPTYNQPDNVEDAKLVRQIMKKRSKKVKVFFTFTNKATHEKDQFQWLPCDKKSRVEWLEGQIELLKGK